MRHKQPNIIESVIRTSQNPNKIILNAFDKVPKKTLSKFFQVALDHLPFKGSFIKKIETRKFEEVEDFTSPPFLVDVADSDMFYLCLGILERNILKIREFVQKEKEFNRSIYTNDGTNAFENLRLIDTQFGFSFWGEASKIAVLAIDKREQEYQIPNTLKENSLPTILLNYCKDFASNCFNEESLHNELISEYNKSTNTSDTYEFIKYKTFGFNPRLELDLYRILKFELRGTLVDLYKVFEIVCLNNMQFSTDKDIRKLSIKFLKDVKHESFQLSEQKEINLLDFSAELKVVDEYSTCKYLNVVNLCESIAPNDIGILTLCSKSLSYIGYRFIEDTFYKKIYNLLADIFNKTERFNESSNVLYSICHLLRTNYKFLILNEIIYNETFPVETTKERSFFSTKFSNIPTAFKLADLLSKAEMTELYKSQMPYSETFNLYNSIEEYPSQTTTLSPKNVKYFARKMLLSGNNQKAIELYEKSGIALDNEMNKDYLLTLVNCNRTLDAIEHFFYLYLEKPNALKYFSINSLYNKVVKEVNSIKSILIPLCLYLYREIQDTSINKSARAIALKKYVRDCGVKRPSELSFPDDDKKTIIFLEHVCNRDLLCKSMLFRYQTDAYDERIKICNLLISRKLSNIDKLVFETKELSKRKVLEDAAQHVSSSKVYADKDFVRTNTWDDYINYFDEYININLEHSEIEEQLELAIERLSKKKISDPYIELMSNQVKAYLEIGDDKKAKALFSLTKCIVEEYCFGIKGLNGYLSTRIRHQTFFSTLLGPLINEGIVSDDKIGKDNEFLSPIENIESSILNNLLSEQIKFNEKITKSVNNLLFKNVQICANGKGNNKCAFNYLIEIETLNRFQKKLGSSPSINETWDTVETWIIEQTNKGSQIIQTLISSQLKEELEVAINEFELKIEKLISESKAHNSSLLLNKIKKCRPLIFNQLNIVNSWFDIDHSYVEREYTFDIVTDIVETMLSTESILSTKVTEITVPHRLLSPLVDLLHNIFSNAIKYSSVESRKLKISLTASQKNNLIHFSIKNNANFLGDIDTENLRLEKYKERLSTKELKSLLQKEGGSGIAKVKSILKHDLFSDETVELKYINKNEFIISFSIDKSAGIIFNENTNS